MPQLHTALMSLPSLETIYVIVQKTIPLMPMFLHQFFLIFVQVLTPAIPEFS